MSIFHNNALLGASGNQSTGAYEISRSLRFESDDSAYLSRGSFANSDTKTMTFSFWLKRCSLTATKATQYIFSGGDNGTIFFDSGNSDKLSFNLRGTSGTNFFTTTSAELRDLSAWYHIVVALDLDNSTTSERFKCWINNVQQTMSNTSYPNNNYHDGGTWYIGSYTGTQHYPDYYLAEFHYVAGQALAATDFGEYDDDDNWNPKAYSGSYGTNGFYLDFSDNSSNSALGTDSSGNSNNWTVNNLSIGTSYPFSAEFDGSTSQYIRKSGGGVLPDNNGNFTVECHFLPRTSSVRGLFDGGAGEVNIIRNYDTNEIGKQGGPVVDIAGDYTVGDWNHMAACYNASNDTLNVFINGTSSGTCSFSSYSGGSNFDIGTINAGGDGKFNGLIRNFRVTNTVVYSSNFTAPSHTSNLTNISGTQLLLFTTDANGLLTDGSSANHTLANNGGVYPYIAGADNDSLIDTPTDYTATSGNNGGNYAVLNALDVNSSTTLSDGNLFCDKTGTSGYGLVKSSIAVSSGKWYCEYTLAGADQNVGITLASHGVGNGDYLHSVAGGVGYYSGNGQAYTNSGNSAYGNTFGAGDVIGIALDLDNGKVFFSKNGTFQNSGNPAAGTNPAASSLSGTYVFGRHSGSQSNTTADGFWNFGQRSFKYTPPTNYLSLCTTNLDDPTIAKGSDHFDVNLWTGGGSNNRAFRNFDFQPDIMWHKVRSSSSTDHYLFDSVREADQQFKKYLRPNSRGNAASVDGVLESFYSDGYLMANGSNVDSYDKNNETYVGWIWDAGTTTSSNTNGSITSQVRASTTTGTSIVTYEGTGANATVGHGLSSPPDWIIFKDINRDDEPWFVYHSSLGSSAYLFLNTMAGQTTGQSDFMNSTDPTSSVFSLGNATGKQNRDGSDFLALCWTAVEGYSAFGTYEGNGSNDGPFVYTGFRPRWILRKSSSEGGTGFDWVIIDSKRDSVNISNSKLYPQYDGAENVNSDNSDSGDNSAIDILSNGFKVRASNGRMNKSGTTFIYAAFAEHSIKTARAR